VPVEVLGTLEVRQFIESVSRHYDRVLFDGPAILGLADCRILGRMVDAAILVVRAGAQTLPPLLRAREMLIQSRVEIAGVVLNALREDMQNWSSHANAAPYLDGRPIPRLGRDRIRGVSDDYEGGDA
jgi:succinoglycan biosynthesis transport protein ExoP